MRVFISIKRRAYRHAIFLYTISHKGFVKQATAICMLFLNCFYITAIPTFTKDLFLFFSQSISIFRMFQVPDDATLRDLHKHLPCTCCARTIKNVCWHNNKGSEEARGGVRTGGQLRSRRCSSGLTISSLILNIWIALRRVPVPLAESYWPVWCSTHWPLGMAVVTWHFRFVGCWNR